MKKLKGKIVIECYEVGDMDDLVFKVVDKDDLVERALFYYGRDLFNDELEFSTSYGKTQLLSATCKPHIPPLSRGI